MEILRAVSALKGSWLTIWLDLLGAKLYGLALEPPTSPSLFNEANLEKIINNNIVDIRDLNKVTDLVNQIKPDYIFHLAAQPLVKYSYLNPTET